MDLGLSGKSKVPSRRGGLDLGLAKILEPGTRGGVLESDLSIRSSQKVVRLYLIKNNAVPE